MHLIPSEAKALQAAIQLTDSEMENVSNLGRGQGLVCSGAAKLFVDFILSEEVQNIWGSTLTNRPVMKDAATNDAMTPMADINVIEEDIPYVSAHKSELVDKYTEIFTDLQSK